MQQEFSRVLKLRISTKPNHRTEQVANAVRIKRIQERVDCHVANAIGVSQPDGELEPDVVGGGRFQSENRRYGVHREERRPTDDDANGDHCGQRFVKMRVRKFELK